LTATPLVIVFRFAHASLERNLDGVSEEDALVPPSPGANCANWIVGHLLWSRDGVHTLLGLDRAWPAALGASDAYHRGSTGFAANRAVPLGELRDALGRSQAVVLPELERVTPDRLLERATETMTVGERLAFMGFHESYHVGQVGALRRAIGKPGAIK
jgi:hypothetical protein